MEASAVRRLAVLSTALLLAAAGGATAQRADSGAQAVQATIHGLFDRMAADDVTGAARLLAPGFYAFDASKRFEGDALLQLVKKLHQSGVLIRWNLSPIDVHVSGDMAWAAWDNHGSVGPSGAEKPIAWQESAVLKRENGAWRLVFLHSNRVAAPQ
jgi:ketosteroid isomerase-like protein